MFANASYEENKGRWVVWSNDPAVAEQIKQLHPYDPVYLYDPETKEYKRYTISYIHKKTEMKNGRMIYSEEEIEI